MGNDEDMRPSHHFVHTRFLFLPSLSGNLSQSTFPVTVNPKRLGQKMKKTTAEAIEGGGVGRVICLLCSPFGFVTKIACVVDFLHVPVTCLAEPGYG